MTHFYKGGSELPIGTQCSCPQLTKSNCLKLTILIWGIEMFSMFSLSAQAPRKNSGADGLLIKSLKVGDTIPEELWNISLEVANHPVARTYISLQDYRGKKLIILDFWATWCAGCISSLKESIALQKQFKEDIAIIPVTREPLAKITAKNVVSRNSFLASAFTVFNDSILTKIFRHQTVPHLVWIDRNGIVQRTSLPMFLNQKTVSKAIKYGIYDSIPTKDEYLDRADIMHRLSVNANFPFVSNKLEGTRRESNFFAKGRNNDPLLYFVNYPMLHLLLIANGLPISFPNSSVYINDPRWKDEYFPYQAIDLNKWLPSHMYCYADSMAAVPQRGAASARMKTALEGFFGITSSVDTQWMECVVIKDAKKISQINSCTGSEMIPLNLLVNELNANTRHIVVVNESKQYYKIKYPKSIRSLKRLIEYVELLRNLGLTVKIERRSVSILRINGKEKTT
ncbi:MULTISPECIES: TlpA family protein disulfide reductase [Sphingobacterium]|uniref:TlpA family protein disulfide reductase n=1 Tax=Sphingobacterium TaxID=28453 RepID=UPI00257F6E1D|nr:MULTISPECIES: TlpA disulfide reductase family protein [Sphingobacterium]